MSSTADYRSSGGYAAGPTGAGWVTFAACMLGLAGIWNVIDGLLALGSSHVYGVNRVYVFSDLRTWGWILLVVGILQTIAAFSLMAGSEVARWFGIGVAGLNAIAQLGFIPTYPWWAIAIFTCDILIIYGLAAYGGSRMRI
jgi:hypothetical protein